MYPCVATLNRPAPVRQEMADAAVRLAMGEVAESPNIKKTEEEEALDITAEIENPSFQDIHDALESVRHPLRSSSAHHLLICACSSAHAQVTVPVNDSRKNVKKTQNQIVTGMCLGVVNARANGIATSLASRLRPNLTRTLVNFAKHAKPGFAFTSIQVNKNYASALHCDANNLGPSYIVGVIHSPCSLPYLSLTWVAYMYR